MANVWKKSLFLGLSKQNLLRFNEFLLDNKHRPFCTIEIPPRKIWRPLTTREQKKIFIEKVKTGLSPTQNQPQNN